MKRRFLIILFLFFGLCMSYAESSVGLLYKKWMIEDINRGNFERAAQEMEYVEDWTFDAGKEESWVNVLYAMRFVSMADSLGISKKSVDSLSIYIVSECDNVTAYYYSIGNYIDAIPYADAIQSIIKDVYGENSPEYVMAVCNLALLYNYSGDYRQAESYYLQALEGAKEIFGENHPDYAIVLENAGSLYLDIGEYEKAEQYFLHALAIRKVVLGENNPDYARTLYNLGLLHYNMSNYTKALDYTQQALTIQQNTVDRSIPDYAASISLIGAIYLDNGDYEQAEASFLKSQQLNLGSLGPQHPTYAKGLQNLGNLYKNIGKYKQAEMYYLQALRIYKEIFNENHPDYLVALKNLGVLYSTMGEFKKAEQCYLHVLETRRVLFGESHPDYAASLGDLGLLYCNMGDYQKSEQYLFRALEIRQATLGENHPDYAASLENIGELYDKLGDYHNAELFCLRALKIYKDVFGESHPNYATMLQNIGILYYRIEDYAVAEQYFMLAAETYKDIYSEYSPSYAFILNNLGALYDEIKEYEQAEQCHLKALEIRNEALGENHPDYAYTMANLGALYFNKKDYAKAEAFLYQAMTIQKQVLGENHADYMRSLYNVGLLYEKTGDYGKADSCFVKMFTINKGIYTQSLAFMSEGQRELYWTTLAEYYESTYPWFAYRAYAQNEKISSLAYDNELFKKGLLLASSNAIRHSVLESGDSLLIQKWDELTAKKQQIMMLDEKDAQSPYVSQLREEAEQLEKEITRSSAAYRENIRQWNITWDSVRAELKPNEVAIEFMAAPLNEDSTMYCALLLRDTCSCPILIPLFEKNEVAGLVDVSMPMSLDLVYAYTGYGKQLSQIIWSKITPYMHANEAVYFAPTGLLHQLAIENLPYDATHTMSDVYQMVRVSSTRELALHKAALPHQKASLYGGIFYEANASDLLAASMPYHRSVTAPITVDSLNRSQANYLPATKKEVEQIRQTLKTKNIDVHVYSTIDGNEESFKALSGTKQNVLHLATHGFFWQDATATIDPMERSGLLLAGANMALSGHPERIPEGVEDGILTAKEISVLDFRHADIVVLSACETAKGDVSGEGVFGLQRAFKMAGAQTILMSLWKVDDEATQILMTAFYRNYSKGLTKRQAFRKAQEEVRNHTKTTDTSTTKPYESPYFWAGFILLD